MNSSNWAVWALRAVRETSGFEEFFWATIDGGFFNFWWSKQTVYRTALGTSHYYWQWFHFKKKIKREKKIQWALSELPATWPSRFSQKGWLALAGMQVTERVRFFFLFYILIKFFLILWVEMSCLLGIQNKIQGKVAPKISTVFVSEDSECFFFMFWKIFFSISVFNELKICANQGAGYWRIFFIKDVL